MNTPNPYKPPDAPVADVGPLPTPSRGPVLTLVIAGILTIGWFASWLPGLFALVDAGSMKPIIGLLVLLGEICLAVGLWRVYPLGLRGRRSFLLAIALLLLARVVMGSPRVYGAFLHPFILAMVVALLGFGLVHARLRARREQP